MSHISTPYLSLSHTLASHIANLTHYSPHTATLISLSSQIFTQWRDAILSHATSHSIDVDAELHAIKHHEREFHKVLRMYYTRKKQGKWQEKYEKEILLGKLGENMEGLGNASPKGGAELGNASNSGSAKPLVSISSQNWHANSPTAPSKLKSKTQHSITQNLQQTRSLLSAQLQTSDANMLLVSEMSHLLRDTLQKQHQYERSVRQSGKKISSLKKRDNFDYYVNRAAFYIFLLVCAYIFNKRLRLISLAFRVVWWVMRLFFVWRWFGWGSGAGKEVAGNVEL